MAMPTSPARRPLLLLGAAVAVVVLAVGGFLLWFFGGDEPDAVSLDAATAQVADDTATDGDATDAATADDATADSAADESATGEAATTDGIAGTWSVDTSLGEFAYEDSTGTFVGFRIAEELQSVGSTEAVGRTPTVEGTLVIDGTTITDVTIEASMADITTNDSRRDDNVWEALETDEYPTATFVLTEPIELDDSAATGAAVTVDAVGELTIHGVTQTVTFPLEAQLVDDTIVVVGSLDISFADYGVEVPGSPVVLSVDDHGPIELQLFFSR